MKFTCSNDAGHKARRVTKLVYAWPRVVRGRTVHVVSGDVVGTHGGLAGGLTCNARVIRRRCVSPHITVVRVTAITKHR